MGSTRVEHHWCDRCSEERLLGELQLRYWGQSGNYGPSTIKVELCNECEREVHDAIIRLLYPVSKGDR